MNARILISKANGFFQWDIVNDRNKLVVIRNDAGEEIILSCATQLYNSRSEAFSKAKEVFEKYLTK